MDCFSICFSCLLNVFHILCRKLMASLFCWWNGVMSWQACQSNLAPPSRSIGMCNACRWLAWVIHLSGYRLVHLNHSHHLFAHEYTSLVWEGGEGGGGNVLLHSLVALCIISLEGSVSSCRRNSVDCEKRMFKCLWQCAVWNMRSTAWHLHGRGTDKTCAQKTKVGGVRNGRAWSWEEGREIVNYSQFWLAYVLQITWVHHILHQSLCKLSPFVSLLLFFAVLTRILACHGSCRSRSPSTAILLFSFIATAVT